MVTPNDIKAKLREMYEEHAELEEDWDFWSGEAGLSCLTYDKQIDLDALAVLKGIAEEKFNDEIARELNLPPQYVELLQSIFCHADWADYGTSPRGCFIAPGKNAGELIAKFEADIHRRWEEQP